MTRILAIFLVSVGLATSAAAETNPLRWRGHEQDARRASDFLVAGAIGVDTVHSLTSNNKVRSLLLQGCRVGLAQGFVTTAKFVVHRTRPDGSDDNSFYSGHTTTLMASGWRYRIAIPLSVSGGALRMAANRHYATDVLGGMLGGVAARAICDRWDK
jgi:membrane-associated phospholipid phosphatase